MSDYYLGVDRDGNIIMHSKGAWKKHKYIQKIGEGANAIYKYAKEGMAVNKRVEAEEEGFNTATLNDKWAKEHGGKTGGTYSANYKGKDGSYLDGLKRTNDSEAGRIKYNVKNGKQLFDSYSEKVRVTNHAPDRAGHTAFVEREANITYGYIHRATNQIQKGKKIVEKLLGK